MNCNYQYWHEKPADKYTLNNNTLWVNDTLSHQFNSLIHSSISSSSCHREVIICLLRSQWMFLCTLLNFVLFISIVKGYHYHHHQCYYLGIPLLKYCSFSLQVLPCTAFYSHLASVNILKLRTQCSDVVEFAFFLTSFYSNTVLRYLCSKMNLSTLWYLEYFYVVVMVGLLK